MWGSYKVIASCYCVRITYCQGFNSLCKKEDISFPGRSLEQPVILLVRKRPVLTTCNPVVWGFPPYLCQHVTHQEGIPQRIHSRIFANIKENWKQTCLCSRPGSMLVCLGNMGGGILLNLWLTCLFLRAKHLVCSDVGRMLCQEYIVLNSAVRLSTEDHWRPRAPRHNKMFTQIYGLVSNRTLHHKPVQHLSKQGIVYRSVCLSFVREQSTTNLTR